MPSILSSTLETLLPSSAEAAKNSSSSSSRSSSPPSNSRSFPLGLFAPIEAEDEIELGAKRADRGVDGREDSNDEKPIVRRERGGGRMRRRREWRGEEKAVESEKSAL